MRKVRTYLWVVTGKKAKKKIQEHKRKINFLNNVCSTYNRRVGMIQDAR